MAKRRGRKRKAVAARYPSGDVVRPRKGIDRGTDELQTRRAMLVPDGDRACASYPLGVLWANRIINDDQHRAGCRLAWLYAVVYGRVSPAAVEYQRTQRGMQGADSKEQEQWRHDREKELAGLLEALGRLSRVHRAAVVDVAVFGVLPRWARPHMPTRDDIRAARLFTTGMKALESAAKGMNATLTA